MQKAAALGISTLCHICICEFRIWDLRLHNRKPTAKLRKWQAQEKTEDVESEKCGCSQVRRLFLGYIYIYIFFFSKSVQCVCFFCC